MTIPFVWKLHCGKCRRCTNAVRALQWHVWLRGGWWKQSELPE